MNAKKTLLIAIVLIALLGIYLWDQKRITEKETRTTAENRLVTPHKDDLTAVTINNQGQTLKLKKSDSEWQITQPVETLADKSAVDSLLNQIDSSTKENPFDVAADKLGDFGLAKPTLTTQIEADGKKYIQKLELGAKTPDNTQLYGREEGGAKVFVVPVALETELSKTLDDLRDKRLLPVDVTQATTMTLAFGGKIFQAEKRAEDWKLVLPSAGSADTQKVGDLLRTVYNGRASDFIDTATLDLGRYGLATPAWKGSFYVTDEDAPSTAPAGRVWTLLVGDAPSTESGTRYAMREGDRSIFQIKNDDYDKLTPTYDDLRDKALFTLKAEEVGQAEFIVKGNPIRLKRDAAGQWQLEDNPQARLDQSVVDQKIRDLTLLKATKFFEMPPPNPLTALDKPNLIVTISAKDGRTTETLMTGAKADNEDFVYARTGSGQTYGIEWTKPGDFFLTLDMIEDKFVYRFDVDLAAKIELTEAGRTITLTKKDQSWTGKVKGNDKEYQVEAPKVTSMLYKVTALNWKRRLNPLSPQDTILITTMNLKEPPRMIVISDAEGQELARFGQGGEEATNVYVARGEGDYITIDTAQMGDLKTAIDELTTEMTQSEKPETEKE